MFSLEQAASHVSHAENTQSYGAKELAASLFEYDVPLLRGISPDDLSDLDLTWREQEHEAGTLVFSQDDTSRDVYFLISGTLSAVAYTASGREVIFTRFAPGSMFGELSALDGGPRSLAIYAQSRSKILCMPHGSFMTVLNELPEVRERVLLDLVGRIRSLTEKTLELTTHTTEQRVRSYLTRLALESGCFCEGGVLQNAPSHAEIANSVGATREAVSRCIGALVRQGVVVSGRKRLEFLDPEAMTAQL